MDNCEMIECVCVLSLKKPVLKSSQILVKDQFQSQF